MPLRKEGSICPWHPGTFDSMSEIPNSLVADSSTSLEPLASAVSAREKRGDTASPFVKWVGGKRSVMNLLLARMPDDFKDYYEPFVGGGALFFELAEQGRLTGKTTYLSDANFDLITTYKAIQKDPEPLIARLERHAENHDESYYYRVRSRHDLADPVEIAARFLYLNKTCYNGLWRVNSKGEFNVPAGRYAKPGIVQADKLRLCHEALQGVELACRPFESVTPGDGDFAYLDPPYHRAGATSFTKYSRLDFSERDQVRLRDFALALHRNGVKLMLSNSATEFVHSLYQDGVFKVGAVRAPRLVNCKPDKRAAVAEMLITNG